MNNKLRDKIFENAMRRGDVAVAKMDVRTHMAIQFKAAILTGWASDPSKTWQDWNAEELNVLALSAANSLLYKLSGS